MKKDISVILGGGIAGLLKAYFEPEAILISDQIGGQFNSPFQLGPKYLHVDEYSKRFFSEIGLKPNIKKIKIGFYYKNELHNINTEENRKLYFKKTRGKDKPYQSSMSADATEFDSFDIKIDKIIDLLKNKIQNNIILGKVSNINSKERTISINRIKLKYKTLISTIPLNVFLLLNSKPEIAKEFKTYPTTFVLSSKKTSDKIKEYDYVYFSESEYLFHRVTRTPRGLVLEFKGDNIPKIDTEIDRYILKTGQLIQNVIKIDLENVEFFGRYATWDHSILINKLLKKLYGNN